MGDVQVGTTPYSPFSLASPSPSTRAAPAPRVPQNGHTASPEWDILAAISSKGSEPLALPFPTSQNTTCSMKTPQAELCISPGVPCPVPHTQEGLIVIMG